MSPANNESEQLALKRLNLMMLLKKIQGQLVPQLVVLLTISLPFLHHDISRRYNYQIALVELLIIFAAILVYKRDFFMSLPTDSFEFKLIIVFLMSALISTLASPKISLATLRYFPIVIWLIYLWLMVYLIQEKHLSPRVLIITGAVSCLLPIAVFLISYAVSDTDPNLMATFERLKYYSNIRHFGYHLTAATLFSFYFLIDSHFNFPKLILGVVLILANFSTLVLTESRQGILVIVLFSCLMLIMAYRKYWLRVLCIFIFSLITLTTIAYFNGAEPVFKSLFNSFTSNSTLNGLSSGRIEIWRISLLKMKEGWMLGFGAESFIALRKSMGIRTFVHPHSIIIQSLLEWGLIGSLIYFSIISKALFNFTNRINFRSLVTTPTTTIAYFSIGALLANALIDGIFYHVLPIYFSSICFAILIASGRHCPDIKFSS